MQIKYRGSVGELIWAMTTCRPDIAFTSVKLSQSNSRPAEIHYHGLKHAIRYLYTTKTDGLYYWRTHPRPDLPNLPLPTIKSNAQDLLLDNCPDHEASIAVAYGNSDWATCVKTHRSFSGICIQLASGTIAHNKISTNCCPLLHRSRVHGSLRRWPNVPLYPQHPLGPIYPTGGRHHCL